MLYTLMDWAIMLVVFVVAVALIIAVLSNGAYYGAMAGDLVHGLIDLVTAFVHSVAG